MWCSSVPLKVIPVRCRASGCWGFPGDPRRSRRMGVHQQDWNIAKACNPNPTHEESQWGVRKKMCSNCWIPCWQHRHPSWSPPWRIWSCRKGWCSDQLGVSRQWEGSLGCHTPSPMTRRQYDLPHIPSWPPSDSELNRKTHNNLTRSYLNQSSCHTELPVTLLP